MEIKRSILLKHYEQATIEQLALEYKQKGYEVFPEYAVKQHRFDLVVKKGDDVIVFEIKTGAWKQERRKEIQQLRNFAVHELGAKFKLILVNLPKEPEIEIEGLEGVFPDLLAEHFVDEFSRFATHFWVDEITDIKFDELHIRQSEYEMKGTGIVTLGLQFGSDSDYKQDDGLRWNESFTFHFDLLMDNNLEMKDVRNLELELPSELE